MEAKANRRRGRRQSRKDHRRPRVAIDARVLGGKFDGVGRYLYGMADQLCGRPEIDVILLTRSETSPRYDLGALLARPGVSGRTFTSSPTSFTQQLAWRTVLREVEPDVIFVPYQLSTPLLAGTPTVTTIHDCMFEAGPETSLRVRVLYKTFTRLVLWQAEAGRSEVVCVSEGTRRDIERVYGRRLPERNVVPGGLSGRFLEVPDPTDLRRVQAELGIQTPYLLHVGARRPHKNVAHLLRVLSAVRGRTEIDVKLVLVGAPDERFDDPVPDLIAELGLEQSCIQLGPVPEDLLPAVYAGASVFCFPSLAEGFGLPLVEAMASSVPVVASDIPVFRELAGQSIRYAPPADVGAWTDEVTAALLGHAGTAERCRSARRLAEGAGWSKGATRLWDVLQSAMSSSTWR